MIHARQGATRDCSSPPRNQKQQSARHQHQHRKLAHAALPTSPAKKMHPAAGTLLHDLLASTTCVVGAHKPGRHRATSLQHPQATNLHQQLQQAIKAHAHVVGTVDVYKPACHQQAHASTAAALKRAGAVECSPQSQNKSCRLTDASAQPAQATKSPVHTHTPASRTTSTATDHRKHTLPQTATAAGSLLVFSAHDTHQAMHPQTHTRTHTSQCPSLCCASRRINTARAQQPSSSLAHWTNLEPHH